MLSLLITLAAAIVIVFLWETESISKKKRLALRGAAVMVFLSLVGFFCWSHATVDRQTVKIKTSTVLDSPTVYVTYNNEYYVTEVSPKLFQLLSTGDEVIVEKHNLGLTVILNGNHYALRKP